MTNETQTEALPNGNSNKPTHTLRKRTGRSKNATYETLGVAWVREDGGLYMKLYGTQIIEGGFYAFPIAAAEEPEVTTEAA